MLFRIEHLQGFGDAVALTALLRHLRHYHPDARIEVVCKQRREPLYDGLADEATCTPKPGKPPTHKVHWPLPNRSYAAWPSTYVEQYLVEQFSLDPIPELCEYRVSVREDCRERVRVWLAANGLLGRRLALCNFRGLGMKPLKDVGDEAGAAIVCELKARGYDVLILDANRESTLPENGYGLRLPAVLDPPRSRLEHAGIAAALTGECAMFVGVDSGPLHLAAAVGVRSIGLWTRQSPLHCIAPHGCLSHVCLPGEFIHPPAADGLAYFRRHYLHTVTSDLAEGVGRIIDGTSPKATSWYAARK